MQRKALQANLGWALVQDNPTYRKGVLSDSEGLEIKWHSPGEPKSSQVFCISAFGGLRALSSCDAVLNSLFRNILPTVSLTGPWKLKFEYAEPRLLGETGLGTPTNVDVFCQTEQAVVCIESKFSHDAREGFGGCGQLKDHACAGFHGSGSDLRTKTNASCRLEVAEGQRDPRTYWKLGRTYFRESVFEQQTRGKTCPFARSNYQLMRNLLLAATAAGTRNFGVLAMVPEKVATEVRNQVCLFQNEIPSDSFRSRIAVVAYDFLADLLEKSTDESARDLGRFLNERMKTLL